MTDGLREWMRWEPSRDRRPFGWLVLSPARVTVGIGAAITAVAGLMPWATGTIPGRGGFEPIFFSGLGGAGDGVMLILLALGTAFLVLHHTPATSRVRLVHVFPYLLVLLAALTVLNGYRAVQLEIAAWERRGGSGEVAPGLWLAAAGVVVMAAGLAALLPHVLRWTREATDPADLMTISRRGVAEVLAGLAGILAGGALGIALAESLTPVPVIGLIALGCVFGALLGAYAGTWLLGLAADALEGRRADR
ncbi:MAG TPA: hypothetical protein VFY23_17295 [Candidatus Limnocylindrales bacterium]|nr:hypothetical protein [Candidatus Limnocylindrales bacterium]